MGDPDLIFLDEPTTGFDPAARRQAWSTIRSMCELGKTVFLTTHYMDEAQYLADRVAVMRAGEIIALGTPDELGGRDVRPAEIRFTLPAAWSLGDIPDVPAQSRSLEADRVVLRSSEPVLATQLITSWAIEHDISLGHFGQPADARGHLPGADGVGLDRSQSPRATGGTGSPGCPSGPRA